MDHLCILSAVGRVEIHGDLEQSAYHQSGLFYGLVQLRIYAHHEKLPTFLDP